MTATRREFIKTVGAAIAASRIPRKPAAMVTPLVPLAGGRRKVIYDQDNSGPFSSNTLGTLMMLQADNVDLLGITLVTGNAWIRQEMAFTLRLLEMMGRTEIPVYLGAEFPMINTKEEWLLRLQLYGGHGLDSSMGAFHPANGEPAEISPLPSPYDRFAHLKAQEDHAARFIIRSVRENPGQVIIYAGGPLTNLALAIALAPDIVSLVPEVVVMGTGFHLFTNTFNMFFDPEAARKVLRAPWPRLIIVPVDLADEICIFTKSKQMFVDICSTPGPRYGDSMFWPPNWQEVFDQQRYPVSASDRRVFVDPRQFYLGPPPAAGLVNVLLEVNHNRFKRLFVDLMTKPIRKTGS